MLSRPQQTVQDYAPITTAATPTLKAAQLQTASELESRLPNPKYISGPTLVMESFNEEAMADFVRGWRYYFFDSMQTQFLPTSCSTSQSW
jgi:hypothetical protein